jgi:hypothetical protein
MAALVLLVVLVVPVSLLVRMAQTVLVAMAVPAVTEVLVL